MSHRRRRITLTIAVLPLVLLVGLRSVWASYACRIDGEVRAKCCCPKKEKTERQPTDGAPRIAPADCCDVESGESSAAPQARQADRASPDAPPLIAFATVPALPLATPAARVVVNAERARPPPLSVPTYLANRTILR